MWFSRNHLFQVRLIIWNFEWNLHNSWLSSFLPEQKKMHLLLYPFSLYFWTQNQSVHLCLGIFPLTSSRNHSVSSQMWRWNCCPSLRIVWRWEQQKLRWLWSGLYKIRKFCLYSRLANSVSFLIHHNRFLIQLCPQALREKLGQIFINISAFS